MCSHALLWTRNCSTKKFSHLNEKAKLEAIKGLVKSNSHSNHKAAYTTGAPRDFRSIKQFRVLLPLDGIVIHRKINPQQFVAAIYLYSWVGGLVWNEVSCRFIFNLFVIFFNQPRNETDTESTPSRRRRDTGNLVLVSIAIRVLGLLVSLLSGAMVLNLRSKRK